MRLVEALKILNQAAPAGTDELRVSLACGFMPLHLQTFLSARLRQATGRPVKLTTGLYGDFLGNLERLTKSPADAIAIVMEWSDLDSRLGLRSLNGWRLPDFADLIGHVRAKAARIQELLKASPGGTPLILQLPTLPLPPLEAVFPTWRAGNLELQLHELLSSFALEASAHPAVKLTSSAWLDRNSPPAARFDVQSELLSGFPYSVTHADALGEALANLIHPRPPKKGLITDLDDTVWKGILGEIGSAGVSWDIDQKSHMHAMYQECLRSLAETGVLLAVASKNEPDAVEEAFGRQDLLLTKDRIFPLEAHWGPKSGSVGRILETWNIGADSVVFVDDSPAELAEVKSVHPEVECILFPKNPQDVYQLLAQLRDRFAKSVVTEEDRLRLDSIRGNRAIQEQARGFGGNPDSFLEQAESVLTFNFDKASPDPRVLELLNKTNQFNLNGKRYTEAGLSSQLQNPCTFLMKASYTDKFAPLGKIAILIGRMEGTRLHVDGWVMSCRAFSRRIEHAFLHKLFERFAAQEIEFDYLPTAKNAPLQEFFRGLLEAPLDGPLTLTRERFQQTCPRLFHRVEDEF